MENKIIKAIFVEDIGWVYADNAPIEVFMVNGEMALVAWYRKANEEYNGRYVECVRYETTEVKMGCEHEWVEVEGHTYFSEQCQKCFDMRKPIITKTQSEFDEGIGGEHNFETT